MIGLSLSLIFLVIRPQGARGCPSAESDTNWTGYWPEPAALRRPGQGHRRVSRAQCLRAPLFSTQKHARTLTLYRCLVQPQAVTSNRNQVSRNRLVKTNHQMFFGRLPRPREAYVCPLDSVGLIGVSQSALLLHFQVFVGGGGGA